MSQPPTNPGHRVSIAGHQQPNGMQWRLTCTCGWEQWNLHPHGAQQWATQHEQAHNTQAAAPS